MPVSAELRVECNGLYAQIMKPATRDQAKRKVADILGLEDFDASAYCLTIPAGKKNDEKYSACDEEVRCRCWPVSFSGMKQVNSFVGLQELYHEEAAL